METVPKSLRHSCRSELTRQGISLKFVAPRAVQLSLLRHHRGPSTVFWFLVSGFGSAVGGGRFRHLLHVAMQFGLYLQHQPRHETELSGIKSLRILPRATNYAQQPFLLIVCTPGIVTHLAASTRRFTDVPANGQI